MLENHQELVYQPRQYGKECRHSIPPFLCPCVQQGSVLSPMLFLVVMDSLLHHLHTSGLGLSINGLTLSSAAHADDIRSTSNSITDLQKQGEIIKQFATDNALKLNVAKTELIQLSARNLLSEEIQLTGQSISAQSTAKCLGYWWHTNLTPVKSIEENISKAGFLSLPMSNDPFSGQTSCATSPFWLTCGITDLLMD